MTRTVAHPGTAAAGATRAADAVRLRPLGPMILDTPIAGERKADGVVPGHPGGGALQLGRDRWIVFFATLDPRGWDANRAILYQVRSAAPDGPIIRQGAVALPCEDWDPLGDGQRLFKSCGMPIAFGVPRGARHHGRAMPNAGVFVVKWYRWAHRRQGGRLLNPSHDRARWPQGVSVKQRTLRLEWMQFTLNDAGDDIRILQPSEPLRQRGFERGDAFCSLGPGLHMNHAMKAPAPADASCTRWIGCDGFVPHREGAVDHHGIAPVRFDFNPATGLYEWTATGAMTVLPDRRLGETSINRIGSRWVVAARGFEYAGGPTDTAWFSTDDPMAGLGRPRHTPAGPFPRTAFVCADGVLRLFTNDAALNRSPHERAALCCWDVDPDRFTLSNRRVAFDAHAAGLGFDQPMVDMAKLCPAQGGRQLLLFRAIDRSHTCHPPTGAARPPVPLDYAGIHAAEFMFTQPKDGEREWEFADTSTNPTPTPAPGITTPATGIMS